MAKGEEGTTVKGSAFRTTKGNDYDPTKGVAIAMKVEQAAKKALKDSTLTADERTKVQRVHDTAQAFWKALTAV